MTATILQSLHQDHANQLQLLSLIEIEVNKLGDETDPAIFELLSLALEYCSDFPSNYHHPKEDCIYRKLAAREPCIAERVFDLLEDHKVLNALTADVSSAVARAIAGQGTDGLREAAERFTRHYRYHIGIEEAEIFPRARKVLTEADWTEIASAYEDETDPLFSEHTRQAYIALQQCIVERAVGA